MGPSRRSRSRRKHRSRSRRKNSPKRRSPSTRTRRKRSHSPKRRSGERKRKRSEAKKRSTSRARKDKVPEKKKRGFFSESSSDRKSASRSRREKEGPDRREKEGPPKKTSRSRKGGSRSRGGDAKQKRSRWSDEESRSRSRERKEKLEKSAAEKRDRSMDRRKRRRSSSSDVSERTRRRRKEQAEAEEKEITEVVSKFCPKYDARNKRVAIVFRGLPGCGKTTVAHMLQFMLAGRVVDYDECVKKYLKRLEPDEAWLEELKQAVQWKENRFIYIVRPHKLRDERSMLEDALQDFKDQGGKLMLVDFKHDDDPKEGYCGAHIAALAERIKKRGNAHDTFHPGDSGDNLQKCREHIEKVAESVEHPTAAEIQRWEYLLPVSATGSVMTQATDVVAALRAHLKDQIFPETMPKDALASELKKAWDIRQQHERKWRGVRDDMLCTKCGVEGGNDLVNITSVLRAEQGQRSQKKETKLCRECWTAWDNERKEQKRQEAEAEKERLENETPKPLYWEVRLPQAVQKLVAGKLPAGVRAVAEPHVKLVQIKEEMDDEAEHLNEALSAMDGENIDCSINKIIVMGEMLVVGAVIFENAIPMVDQDRAHVLLGLKEGISPELSTELMKLIEEKTSEELTEKNIWVVPLKKPKLFQGYYNLKKVVASECNE